MQNKPLSVLYFGTILNKVGNNQCSLPYPINFYYESHKNKVGGKLFIFLLPYYIADFKREFYIFVCLHLYTNTQLHPILIFFITLVFLKFFLG